MHWMIGHMKDKNKKNTSIRCTNNTIKPKWEKNRKIITFCDINEIVVHKPVPVSYAGCWVDKLGAGLVSWVPVL